MKKVTTPRLWLAVVLLLLALAAVWVLHPGNFVRSTQAEKNHCIANLKQIDGAIQFWALENKVPETNAPDLKAVMKYLKGHKLPQCNQGGKYAPGRTIADAPTCSQGPELGHALP